MRRGVVLVVAASFLFLNAVLCFSQELTQDKTIKPQDIQVSEPDVQWLWGEVVAVNADKSEITVKYLDYEADIEREMAVIVDTGTTYENIKGLSDLKAQDTVSIDYLPQQDGKSIAKNISVERPEAAQPQQDDLKADVLQAMPETGSQINLSSEPAVASGELTAGNVTQEVPPAN